MVNSVRCESDLSHSADTDTVSVVLPTHNRADVLPRALDSVLEQTHENLEVIVVDDASTDDTESVIGDYGDDRITYVRHEKSRGGSGARNTGIERASGTFVAFLDDDDEWRPHKLEAQLDAYDRADGDVGVVYVGIENVDSRGRTNGVNSSCIEGDVTRELLLRNFTGSFSVLLADAETVERTGPLDERFPSWQDWEYYIRLSRHAKFVAVPEPLVVRHNAAHEQISDDVRAKLTETYPLFRDKFAPLAAECGPWFERRRRGRLLFQLGYSALSNGQYGLSRRLLTRSLVYDPTNKRVYVYWLSSLGGRYTYRPVQALKRWAVRQFR
ncbi:glycosyltransferase family 2 protein [Halococcus sp. PRR34]|uniref:glycosyltransferase family 2 protein n=1 Tax=Halococcus sp. PRR34 TaxID=3020830 RepID=UPI00235E77D0|nr:glycosyltransferase family 2 protein [Halococcus sp. PRR34]